MRVPENLRELVELYQEEEAETTCVFWRDEEITYRQLNERTNRVANGLKALGVKKGDVVSVYLPNCPDYFYVWFGITKLGAVFGPINALFKGDEVRHVLSDSGAVAVITSEALLDTIRAARGSCPALQHIICLEGEAEDASAYSDLLQNSSELEAVEIARNDLAAIVYTSGTTGKPKGAMLSHWNYVWDTMAAADSVPNASRRGTPRTDLAPVPRQRPGDEPHPVLERRRRRHLGAVQPERFLGERRSLPAQVLFRGADHPLDTPGVALEGGSRSQLAGVRHLRRRAPAGRCHAAIRETRSI